MRLSNDPRLPTPGDNDTYGKSLNRRLYDLFRSISRVCNLGLMWDGESSSVPDSSKWSSGAMWRNTSPSEAGTAGGKYVVIGWVGVAGPAWKEMRVLTGG